jgi:hypothetical protein
MQHKGYVSSLFDLLQTDLLTDSTENEPHPVKRELEQL